MAAVSTRTFAKFTFFKLDPAWQRRDPEARAEDKREFLAACEDFAQDRSLRAYSTVGTRGDTDLLLLAQSPALEDIHTFHVVLAQSGLAKWMSIPHSYLAMTKRSPYSESDARPEICTSERRYLFVYPFEKQRAWYRLPASERQRIMDEHIAVGRRYPEITINTSYSFGLDDQEFVVSFEADEPGQFLDLVQELRGSESSSYTLRDTPIFTCVSMSVGKALDALDGAATARRAVADPILGPLAPH
ncbi:MAG TPA: chlorite dismutase family protein [Solirubrobacterales bacterium]|nr:chlorite dismutase family protein [Solirubrobacterales bacterium]